MNTELRRYRIKPDRTESRVAFFRDAVAEHEPHGIRVEYAGSHVDGPPDGWARSTRATFAPDRPVG